MPEATVPSPDADAGSLAAPGPTADAAVEPGGAVDRQGNTTAADVVVDELPPDREQGGDAAAERRPTRRRQRAGRQVVEWLVVAVVALVVAVLLRTFVIQTFYVPSGSMLPTLQIGDRIIVNKLYGTIHRFDIIVFRRTPHDTTTTDADLVKRVIGLPGETLWSKGDTIFVNGKPLNESWLPHTSGPGPNSRLCPQASYSIPVTHVPKGEYFVMGDCRGNSEDSRAWGFVPSSYIVGKVFVVIWRHDHPWLHWF